MTKKEKTASKQKGIPLWSQIGIACLLAVVVGFMLGAGNPNPDFQSFIEDLEIPRRLIFQVLTALAAPLIFLVLLKTLIETEISGKDGKRLLLLMLQNTIVATLIGFLVFSIIRPSVGILNIESISPNVINIVETPKSFWEIIVQFLQNITPEALLKALVENNFISLVFIAFGFGLVLRGIKLDKASQIDFESLEKIIEVLAEAVNYILKWVISLLPIAVFCIVAQTIAEQGFELFISFIPFIMVVILASLLQICYYLVRIRFGSWVNPLGFLFKPYEEVWSFAFLTASSALTIPQAFKVFVKDKDKDIGLKQESGVLGINIGGNISKDGTALYLTICALFVSQLPGYNFSLGQYVILFFLSILASVCTTGIPGAGIVMMTLVFTTLNLPTKYVELLLSVYWFLDMCITVINVMGYTTLATLLDGKNRIMNSSSIL